MFKIHILEVHACLGAAGDNAERGLCLNLHFDRFLVV